MSNPSIARISIIGTGLIGSSIGLALRAHGFSGYIAGWDQRAGEAGVAQQRGAIDAIAPNPVAAAQESDLVLLATPVFGILDWMERLAPALRSGQLVTDVGSTKRRICERAAELFAAPQRAAFLAGHPMAGKEVYGAAEADAELFRQAVWLFCPTEGERSELERERMVEWRSWVERFGCRIVDTEPVRHDDLCAWASHLPQMVGTALAALLEDTFGASERSRGELRDVGGRAMREMTRLGASPFSMWRDVAHTNTAPIAATLMALEQRLAYIRQNLTTAGLREEFERANRFRQNF